MGSPPDHAQKMRRRSVEREDAQRWNPFYCWGWKAAAAYAYGRPPQTVRLHKEGTPTITIRRIIVPAKSD